MGVVDEEASGRTTFQYSADALLGGVFPSPGVSAATCQATLGTGLLSIGALDTTVTVDHSYEFDRASMTGGYASVRGTRPKTYLRVVGDATDLRVCATPVVCIPSHHARPLCLCCSENQVCRGHVSLACPCLSGGRGGCSGGLI